MAKKKYTDADIQLLKGADRVRKRPAVIFGSDGIEGCKHSVFEILSNSIDEARDGHGNKIILTVFNDGSMEVEDFGRGCPVDYIAPAGSKGHSGALQGPAVIAAVIVFPVKIVGCLTADSAVFSPNSIVDIYLLVDSPFVLGEQGQTTLESVQELCTCVVDVI